MTEATSELEARVRAGTRLEEADLRQLAALDVLTLGMLADDARRRLHGSEVTFVRVHDVDVANGWTASEIPAAASEIRLRGLPASLDVAITAVAAACGAAGERTVSGFSLVELATSGWGALDDILTRLRAAGLDAIAEAAIDRLPLADAAWTSLRTSGLSPLRLTVERTLGDDRVATLLEIRRAQDAGAGIRAVAPLPRIVPVATPTTGYDDVRAVALARLALDNVPTIQVDWPLYGPKLAQVALTFGADDIDGIAADESPERGWRRAPAEEARRNISAAALTAVERDGRYAKRSA